MDSLKTNRAEEGKGTNTARQRGKKRKLKKKKLNLILQKTHYRNDKEIQTGTGLGRLSSTETCNIL